MNSRCLRGGPLSAAMSSLFGFFGVIFSKFLNRTGESAFGVFGYPSRGYVGL